MKTWMFHGRVEYAKLGAPLAPKYFDIQVQKVTLTTSTMGK